MIYVVVSFVISSEACYHVFIVLMSSHGLVL